MVRRLSRPLLAVLLLAAAVAPAAAQMSAKRRELGRIQKELEAARVELERLRREESSLSREADRLKSRDGETRRRVEDITRGIRRVESRRDELKSRIGTLSSASDFWNSALFGELREHVRILDIREPAWSGAELWGEAFRRSALLEKARVLAALRGSRIKTEADAEAVRRRAAELKSKGRQAEVEETRLRGEYLRTQAAASEARERLAAAEKRARELEETKAALAQLLSRMGAKPAPQNRPVRLELPRNSLPWPVAGTVARPYGRERNEELGSWVFHQGVTFSASAGARVGAVRAGQVIFSGPFRSYGRVVIVDHGGEFFSVYGELGEILKAKGAAVEPEEAVGTAGERGVYLELRRGTEALDPMLWLRKGR
ncbi:MAG: peptidoglycan DD-metalloendopeptidase family protein [Elusimicrobia bacterium]|nr:peptidoglycan DD-metalloendopeptidase family protein [Elusimicrobiota bacterium]